MIFCSKTMQGALVAAVGFTLMFGMAGCSTPDQPQFPVAANKPQSPELIKLKEGDIIRITFPGTPDLDSRQQIRRDGRITLPLGVGEVLVAGLTPGELEKQLMDRYSSQLVAKTVTVSIEVSSFPVFVTGAVVHPGKILSDRPLTALEAIMEAGGFDYSRADLKGVKVIRNVGGRLQHYTLNLKRVLQGQDSATFNLKAADIIYVPEKFSWF